MMRPGHTFAGCIDSRRKHPPWNPEPRRKNPVVAIKIVVERFFGTLWNSSSLEFSGVTRELTRISTILPPALCNCARQGGREPHSADFFARYSDALFWCRVVQYRNCRRKDGESDMRAGIENVGVCVNGKTPRIAKAYLKGENHFMASNDFAVVVLAAGKGTRLKSNVAKVLHRAGGRMLVEHVVHACKGSGARRICVVVGYQADEVAAV